MNKRSGAEHIFKSLSDIKYMYYILSNSIQDSRRISVLLSVPQLEMKHHQAGICTFYMALI